MLNKKNWKGELSKLLRILYKIWFLYLLRWRRKAIMKRREVEHKIYEALYNILWLG